MVCNFETKGGNRMKRRIITLMLCLVAMLTLAVPASAENAASGISSLTTVTTDGNCVVSMTVTLRMENAAQGLTFPLPLEAENIKKDGSFVKTRQAFNAILVDLSSLDGFVGETTLNFTFEMKDVVALEELDDKEKKAGKEPELMLTMPLLSGFSYPVQNMRFSVMLPSNITTNPVFSSIYHQDSIESDLTFTVESNQISGNIANLKDNETLAMTLVVPVEMFPGVSTYQRTGNPEISYMVAVGVIALIYWLIFLRNLPFGRARRTTPPEGITAGELGTRLTLCGADLTMMVLTWAQLGYIMIHLDDNGRVMLHKRMDMGNERNSFENKTFKALFGNRRVIDGTGYQYARLARKVAGATPGRKSLCKKGSGNMKLFRILGCVLHGICGVCLAMNLTVIRALQIILAIILFLLAAVSGWYIQEGMYRIHLRYKTPLWISLVLCLVWTLIGVWAGVWYIPLVSVLVELLFGLMAAYGGQRSDAGRMNASNVLGLRSFLKHISQEDIQRLQHNDPEFFYNMAPYAMALGVDKAFAKNFGRKKLEPCHYFVCGINGKMTAEDWNKFFHEAAEILDSRQRRMPLENFAAIRIHIR